MESPERTAAIASALVTPSFFPPGTTAAFLEQRNDRPAIIAILVITTLVFVVAAIRCYARTCVVRIYGQDDWLALVSLAPFAAFSTLCLILVHLGAGRHHVYYEYLLGNARHDEIQKIDFVAHLVYTTALLLCRLSGLAFYARLSDRTEKLIWPIRAAAVTMAAGYLAQMSLLIFHCLPVTALWPQPFQADAIDYKCLRWPTVYITNSSVSLICDLMLFVIPTIIITELHISRRRKVQLSLIMMPGLLVIGISLCRVILIDNGRRITDQSWNYNLLLAVEVAEIGSTLIALSIPALKPLAGGVASYLDRTLGTVVSRRSRPSGGDEFSRAVDGGKMTELRIDQRPDELAREHTGGISVASTARYAWSVVQDDENASLELEGSYSASAYHCATDESNGGVPDDLADKSVIQRHVEYSVTSE